MTFSSYQSEKLFRCPSHLLPLLQKFHLALVEITKAWKVVHTYSGKDSHFWKFTFEKCTYLVHAGDDEEETRSNGSAFLDTAKTENDSSFVFLKNRYGFSQCNIIKKYGK